jgi:hypothetical protein
MARPLDLDDRDLGTMFDVEIQQPRPRRRGAEADRLADLPEGDRGAPTVQTRGRPDPASKTLPSAGAGKPSWWARQPPGSRRDVAVASVSGLTVSLVWLTVSLVLSGRRALAESAPAGAPAAPPPRGGGRPAAPAPTSGTLEVDTHRTWAGKPMPAQLRATPGPSGARLALVPGGAVVSVLGTREVGGAAWYQVRTPSGDEGWMHGEVLK